MDSIFINLHKILGYKYLLLYKDSIPGSSVLKVTFFRKFDEAQNNMPNHYLKLEVLKLHLVVMYGSSECMGKTFQAATTNTWELFDHRSLL